MSPVVPTVPVDGPAALRALARAFGQFHDFGNFVSALSAALEKSAVFEKTTLLLERNLAEGAAPFSPGSLTLPVSMGQQRLGVVQVSGDSATRLFGSEDLHLMAGLADFLGAVLGQSLRFQEAEKARELLRFLLSQAPVGIAAYGEDLRPIVTNDLATRWLAGLTLPAELLTGEGGGFHLQTGGKLIYGEARKIAGDTSGSILLVLHDLTLDQVRLLELLKRDTYRALAEHDVVSFAIIESPQVQDGVLRALPAVRAQLTATEAAGPYDAHRIALVFRGARALQARARLRTLRAALGSGPLRLGLAELGRNGNSPEALLDAALQQPQDFDAALRARILVHDENPDVAQSFALFLGKEFQVVVSTQTEEALKRVRQEPFEAIVTELEPRNGPAGLDVLAEASAAQPGIQGFITTLRAPLTSGIPAEIPLIEKPFDISAITALFRQRLTVVAK